jgi:large repetitive protein
MNKLTVTIISIFVIATFAFVACSKGGGGTTPPPNPCASKTIAVTGTTTATTTPTASNGSISASATGSSGFTFSLNGGAFQASGTFSGLAVGSYTITAKDGDACTGSQVFSVTATPCPTITVTATLTQASSPTATNGAIAATGAGSTGFTYNINGGTFQASGTFTNLAVGSYTITAKDANGCIGSNAFSVTAATCPTITLTTTPTNTTGPTATNGSIVATVTGGVTPHTFSRDGGTTFQSSNTFNNLAVGTYAVVAKDANGCLSGSVSTSVAATCPTITSSAATTNTVKCESNTGTITITASGSSGFTYNLNGGSFQASNTFGTLAIGVFSYGVRDANGCTTTGNATISQAPAGTLFTAVKAVLAANCATTGCHALPSPQSGINFADDCQIVSQALRIKARAVDSNPSVMPPSGLISAADRQKIVDWINAGGKHNN